jgi:hypothetical protein
MADDDDLRTRIALLERSMVTRDQLGEREDRMMDRLEKMLSKFEDRMDDALGHGLKVYGHQTADQLRLFEARIHEDRDDKLDKRDTALRAEISSVRETIPAEDDKPKGEFLARWGLPLGISALVGGPGTVVQVMNLITKLSAH